MAKAVFIQSSHSDYRDVEGVRYHFPNRNYLSVARQTVGDWVLFYEGRRGGNRGYYAAQRVERIDPDALDPTHSYAILDPTSEIRFDQGVGRLRSQGETWETGLPLQRGKNTSAVRLISDADYWAIFDEGLRVPKDRFVLPRIGIPDQDGPTPYQPPLFQDRSRLLMTRAFRDPIFARQVKRAYGGRCAISGLALRNGGGRTEVEAAHIIPVEERGPDTVLNGLALSGTVHWMFDRGFLAISDDYRILVAPIPEAQAAAERLVVGDRLLRLPENRFDYPHTTYLRWHREHRYKGPLHG